MTNISKFGFVVQLTDTATNCATFVIVILAVILTIGAVIALKQKGKL